MKSARQVDIIDVNRIWIVYVGTRAWGCSIGTVQAADAVLARKAAIIRWPNIRIGFVEELA